jgi:NAD(P)H-dependent FMN reductase
MPKINIIIGSTRDARLGDQIATWLMSEAGTISEARFELVDLKTVNLPLLNEPRPPSAGDYQHDSTKKWSQTVDEADGFVFVTPEYNHSIPASLKNAIDTAAREWAYKPIGFVGYGVTGGLRSVEHLRQIMGYLKMYDISEQVSIADHWSYLDKNNIFQANEKLTADAQRMLKSLIFWADKMTPARKELAR